MKYLSDIMHEMEKGTIAQHHYVCLLIDFYSPLLTPHQRSVLNDYYLEDMSLSEIADNNKVSRQAVYDALRRGVEQLEDYEAKLKQVERHLLFQQELTEICTALENNASAAPAYEKVLQLLNQLHNS